MDVYAWNMISSSDAMQKKVCHLVSWNLIWQRCLFCTLSDHICLHELMGFFFLGYIATFIVVAANPCTNKRTYALPFFIKLS